MENLKVNYRKNWGNDGTVYTQTIKTTKEIAKKFNEYIKELKEETAKKSILHDEDMKILYYLEELKDGMNYTGLTTLEYFKTFCIKNIYASKAPKRNLSTVERLAILRQVKPYERILKRNTIIEVL